MATNQISIDVSNFIRKWLEQSGTPQFEAAKWAGMPPANLSQRLLGGVEWKLNELAEFSEQVFGMPLHELIAQASRN